MSKNQVNNLGFELFVYGCHSIAHYPLKSTQRNMALHFLYECIQKYFIKIKIIIDEFHNV